MKLSTAYFPFSTNTIDLFTFIEYNYYRNICGKRSRNRRCGCWVDGEKVRKKTTVGVGWFSGLPRCFMEGIAAWIRKRFAC